MELKDLDSVWERARSRPLPTALGILVLLAIAAGASWFTSFFGERGKQFAATEEEQTNTVNVESDAVDVSEGPDDLVSGTTMEGADSSAPALADPLGDARASGNTVFSNGSPFPRGFELIKPGIKLSIAKSLFEDAVAASDDLHVDLSEESFDFLLMFFDPDSLDPEIRHVIFRLRDAKAAEQVRKELLFALKGHHVETIALGEVLRWPDIDGFRVELDSKSYKIRRAE